MYGRNPNAPQGVTALTLAELGPGWDIVIHYLGPKPRTVRATVLAVYRTYERVALRYASGHADTEWASDLGMVPSHFGHGWSLTYTTAGF